MTTIGSVQEFVANVGPYFLHNKYMGAFFEAVAVTYDLALQTLDFGLRLSQPLRCHVSALPILSRDRTMPFYPGDSVASRRYRLTQWKQLARQWGTHPGELNNAQPYFLPARPLMRIVHQDGLGASATWHTLDQNGIYTRYKRTPSNWNWDATPSKWSRFWVIAYAPAEFLTLPHYGDGSRYGDGTRYAGARDSVTASDLVGMIRGRKAAHSRLSGYIIATDPASFDPTASSVDSGLGWTTLPVGNWGQPIDANGTRTRLPSAVWIYDTRKL
jgi:hypothetical protein